MLSLTAVHEKFAEIKEFCDKVLPAAKVIIILLLIIIIMIIRLIMIMIIK